MPDYLLIRSGGPQQIADALVVAADLSATFGDAVSVDIATTEALLPIAQMSPSVRLAVGFPKTESGEIKDVFAALGDSGGADGGGWKTKMLGTMKGARDFLGSKSRLYLERAADLRIVTYDAIFDLDKTLFSLSVSKVPKKTKVIGFDDDPSDDGLLRKKMLYDESYRIKNDLNETERRRQLVARHLNYMPMNFSVPCLHPQPPPPRAGDAPFIYVTGVVPEVFREVIRKIDFAVVDDSAASADDAVGAEECAALVQNASLVIGNGLGAVFAMLATVKTLFIGAPDDCASNATPVKDPKHLDEMLRAHFNAPPPAALPQSSAREEGQEPEPQAPESAAKLKLTSAAQE